MRYDDLQMLYQQLRRELDAAYAQQPWDGTRIDRIAADLLQLERSLAACPRRVGQWASAAPAPGARRHELVEGAAGQAEGKAQKAVGDA